ncbi:MAG TPA: hypothetical protein VIA29_06820 [Thermoanaerobaculia bacterium]|jgi:hypothetical protein
MTGRILAFPRRPLSVEEGREMARRILAIPRAQRDAASLEAGLEDPETLLSIVEDLRRRVWRDPAAALEDAEFLWEFLRTPGREVGIFDETEYFRGEAALLASVACRHLLRAEPARRWHERADGDFRLTVNAVADATRVGFERLAWALEEGRLSDVLETAPLVAESFRRCGMTVEVLRCDLLAAEASLQSGGRAGLAAHVEELANEASLTGDVETIRDAERLLARVRGVPGAGAGEPEGAGPDTQLR